MAKHRHSFLYRHSLSMVAVGLLVVWIVGYRMLDPKTHVGAFFGNAIADWSGSVVIILGTKFLYEVGSAFSPDDPRGVYQSRSSSPTVRSCSEPDVGPTNSSLARVRSRSFTSARPSPRAISRARSSIVCVVTVPSPPVPLRIFGCALSIVFSSRRMLMAAGF